MGIMFNYQSLRGEIDWSNMDYAQMCVKMLFEGNIKFVLTYV